jgi:hypothetical protein
LYAHGNNSIGIGNTVHVTHCPLEPSPAAPFARLKPVIRTSIASIDQLCFCPVGCYLLSLAG